MAKQKRGLKRGARRGSSRRLIDWIAEYPQILPILDRHGVSFCAGCYLTLNKTPEEAAAYHAVLDVSGFLGELRAAGLPIGGLKNERV